MSSWRRPGSIHRFILEIIAMGDKQYYIYILTNRPHGTLYIGVTNNLFRRILEHKNKINKGFTSKYGLDKLVYYEIYDDIGVAITREKQLKFWKRHWKIKLINEFNPQWKDLSDEIIKNFT